MHIFVEEIREHLTKELIPFWESLRDEKNGGYYGYMDYDLNLDKEAEKRLYLKQQNPLVFLQRIYAPEGKRASGVCRPCFFIPEGLLLR